MPYRKMSASDRYGNASKTITLPLSTWAHIAECCEIMEVDVKTTLIRSVAVLFAQQTRLSKEIAQ
jgi:hypothetical protein